MALLITLLSLSLAAAAPHARLSLVEARSTASLQQALSRRALLAAAAASTAAAAAPHSASAAEESKAREQLASSLDALDELLKRYDEIVAADGGNGIRRVLGKLGPTSPLHRIDKATSVVARGLDDERSFDMIDDFLAQVDAADGDAYSSIFVPTGGGTTPEYWLGKAKKDVVQARATLDAILELK